jgi:hypothetical protein
MSVLRRHEVQIGTLDAAQMLDDFLSTTTV